MIILGHYLDGVSSKIQTSQLMLDDSKQLTLIYTNNDDGQVTESVYSFSDLSVESRLGSTPRQINLPDGQLFTTTDHKAVDLLIAQFKNPFFSSLIHKIESHFTLVLLSIIFTIGFIYGVAQHGIPKMAEVIAHSIPASNVGENGLTLLDETIFNPSDLASHEQDRILAFSQPILDDHKNLKAELVFRSGVPANAFALPDGKIVFTDDLIQLAESDEELISVLLHEIGHIHHKHITRRAIQSSAFTILIFLITGDVDAFDLLGAIPVLLMDFSYSRDFEREADRFALTAMTERGIDHTYFASLMKKLEASNQALPTNTNKSEQEGEDDTSYDFGALAEFFSTHPPTDERIRLYKQLED